jgi:probable rRNA maturation factor
MELEITVLRQKKGNDAGLPAALEALVKKALNAASAAAGYKGSATEAAVLLTDDFTMAAIHGQYLGDPSPTDVICFSASGTGDEPAVKDGPAEDSLGDIVISEDTAKAQALQYGHSLEDEIALLVVHGALHLFGYDDDDDASRRVMREMESRALSLL